MNSIYPTNLPGFVYYHDPTKLNYKKSSMGYQDKKKYGEIQQPKSYYLPNTFNKGTDSTINQNFESSKEYEPDYVKLDKKVLRFFGYFKESIVEKELESGRIRLLEIFYYLTDDTISIVDTRQENSGIPQGGFLSRGKIFKEDGSLLTFKDFKIGGDIMIYSKYVRIYDADGFTRDFCAANGINLGPKQELPEDPFIKKMTTKPKLVKDNIMKEYLEYSMGGGKVKSAKQFLENDRKVLRYYAKFEGLKYIIHYYLSDDTVEIREVNYNNSGRDPFPLLLTRNKLPKKFFIPQPGEDGPTDFYKDSDIEPFMTRWAFNRPFQILGCDEFTADYYLKNYKRNFPLGGFEDPPQKEKGRIVIPPYNGFGSEEDSLGNCLRLVNQPPKKDYYKYIDNDKLILRFLARLNTRELEDVDRRFLISFFLADDTIQVYEMKNRNSGIWEGKFLERNKYKNIENDNKQFTISDFEIGKSMVINTFSFYVIDADEFTKKWLAENLR